MIRKLSDLRGQVIKDVRFSDQVVELVFDEALSAPTQEYPQGMREIVVSFAISGGRGHLTPAVSEMKPVVTMQRITNAIELT